MVRYTCKHCKRSIIRVEWHTSTDSCGRCSRKLREARWRRAATRKQYRGF